MTFTFKGISPEKMGLKIITASGLQRAPCETEIISVPGRQEPLIRTKAELQTTEMTVQLLVTVPKRIREIFSWLSGSGKLIFSDEPDKYYNVLSNDVISLERIGEEIQSFEVKFICEPFAYSIYNPLEEFPLMKLDDSRLSRQMPVYVNGTADCDPLIYLKFAGKLKISINGKLPFFVFTSGKYTTEAFDSTASEKIYKYQYEEEEIYLDSVPRIAYTPNKKVITNQTVGLFPALTHGDNSITFELVSETINYGQLKYKPDGQKLTAFAIQKNERWH